MEIKKSKSADLESQRPTLLLIGLVFSLGVVLQSFEWLNSELIIKPISSYEDDNIYDVINEVTIAKPQLKTTKSSSANRAKVGPVLVIDKPIVKTEPSPTPSPEPNPTPNVKPGFDLGATLPTDGSQEKEVIVIVSYDNFRTSVS